MPRREKKPGGLHQRGQRRDERFTGELAGQVAAAGAGRQLVGQEGREGDGEQGRIALEAQPGLAGQVGQVDLVLIAQVGQQKAVERQGPLAARVISERWHGLWRGIFQRGDEQGRRVAGIRM